MYSFFICSVNFTNGLFTKQLCTRRGCVPPLISRLSARIPLAAMEGWVPLWKPGGRIHDSTQAFIAFSCNEQGYLFGENIFSETKAAKDYMHFSAKTCDIKVCFFWPIPNLTINRKYSKKKNTLRNIPKFTHYPSPKHLDRSGEH